MIACPNCRYENRRSPCAICGTTLPEPRRPDPVEAQVRRYEAQGAARRQAARRSYGKALGIVLVVLAILGAAWAQNQAAEDNGGYEPDTPLVCGQGRC